jgi:gluconate 2-dehydrogenase gamma chain
MNISSHPDAGSVGVTDITRREAIKRTASILGVAISPSILAGVLRAQSMPAGAKAKPAHLTAKQLETAGAVAERIVPKTDTPGALEVGVPAFIDLMYGEYMTGEEKRELVTGLAEVESASVAAHRRNFSQLSAAQQDSVLKRIAEASQKKEKTFFHQIKELTLLGYFTSEPVGKNVLHYDPIPGRYEGCIPLSEVGNVSWTR